jgi:predicted transcriptional regulator
VNTDTLGADAADQARNLVTLCRSNKQRSALVASLRDFEDGLLGTPEEEESWLAWARELDGS